MFKETPPLRPDSLTEIARWAAGEFRAQWTELRDGIREEIEESKQKLEGPDSE